MDKDGILQLKGDLSALDLAYFLHWLSQPQTIYEWKNGAEMMS